MSIWRRIGRWAEATYVWVLRLLLQRRTHALEAFLAAEALVTGLWVLLPGRAAFTQVTALASVPDGLIGWVLTLHGAGAMYALAFGDVHVNRRAALASLAIWGFLAAAMVISPPATHFTVPLVIALALGSLWVYLRLYLRWKLFPPKAGP